MKPLSTNIQSAIAMTERVLVLVVSTAMLLLIGCGTASHNVRIEDQEAFTADTRIVVGLVTNNADDSIDIDIEDMLSDAVMTKLAEEGLLGSPNEPDVLTMELNIIEYKKGSAFDRWILPGYGSTVLSVDATLRDAEGNVDATAEAKRTVDAGGGYTAGAWEYIFDDVAADLVLDLKASILEPDKQ